MKVIIRKVFLIVLATIFSVTQLPLVGFTQETRQSIICQECGVKNLPWTKFCKECGSKIVIPKPKSETLSTTEIKCPECGALNPVGTKFCKECGTKIRVSEISKEVKCPECGKVVPSDTKFCPDCGAKITVVKVKCPDCDTINPPGTKFCKDCGYALSKIEKPRKKITARRERNPGDAIVRSLVLPGWGQFYNEQPTKGYIFAGASGVLVLTSFLMYSQAENVYNDYRNGKASYEDYSSKIDTTNTLIGITAVIWLYNIIDAYISASGESSEEAHIRSSNFSLKTNGERTSLVYVRKF